MKNILLIISLFLMISCETEKKPVEYTQQSNTIKETISFNGGTNWDGVIKNNTELNFFENARYFYLMEIDFRYSKTPSNYLPLPCAGTTMNWNCMPADDCLIPTAPESTMAYNKARLLNWSKKFDKDITISLEVITPYYKNGCKDGYMVRDFPDKFYTKEELGGDIEKIKNNAYNYAIVLLETYDNVIDVIEFGNEPWGEPYLEAWGAWCGGFVDAFIFYYNSTDKKDWNIKLASAACQATYPNPNNNDKVEDIIPQYIRPYISYVTYHPYGFIGNDITDIPEGRTLTMTKDLQQWIKNNLNDDVKLRMTEVGWNSEQIGEQLQSKYLIQTLFLGLKNNVDKVVFYEYYNQPSVPLFSSMGVKGKIAENDLKNLCSQLNDYYMVDSDDNSILLSDGKQYKIVTWNNFSENYQIKNYNVEIKNLRATKLNNTHFNLADIEINVNDKNISIKNNKDILLISF